MNDVVIVALISGAFTLVGTIIGVITSNSLTKYRIEQLEKKVDKHNNLIERTYILEKKQSIIEEKQAVANHRIDDLEH